MACNISNINKNCLRSWLVSELYWTSNVTSNWLCKWKWLILIPTDLGKIFTCNQLPLHYRAATGCGIVIRANFEFVPVNKVNVWVPFPWVGHLGDGDQLYGLTLQTKKANVSMLHKHKTKLWSNLLTSSGVTKYICSSIVFRYSFEVLLEVASLYSTTFCRSILFTQF